MKDTEISVAGKVVGEYDMCPDDNRPDWEQNDPTKANYVHNRPGGYIKSIIKTVTVEADTNKPIEDLPTFHVGDVVNITVNDVDYSLTALADPNNNNLPTLYNGPALYEGGSTWSIVSFGYDWGQFCNWSTTDDIVVKYRTTVHVPFSMEYLPSEVLRTTEGGAMSFMNIKNDFQLFGYSLSAGAWGSDASTYDNPVVRKTLSSMTTEQFDELFEKLGGGLCKVGDSIATVRCAISGPPEGNTIDLDWTEYKYMHKEGVSGYKGLYGVEVYRNLASIYKDPDNPGKVVRDLVRIKIAGGELTPS